jgi:membrane protease YdiL (CAAX protease family)
MNVAIFLPLLVLAVILTFLYEHTGNLLAAITAHAVFNAMNFATLYIRQIST